MRAIFNKLPIPGTYEVFEHPTGTSQIELDSVNVDMLEKYEELELSGEIIEGPNGKKYVGTIWVILDVTRPESATPDRISL